MAKKYEIVDNVRGGKPTEKNDERPSSKPRDSNERDRGAFKGEEESGAEHDGKGPTKKHDPLAPTPKTVL